VKDEDLALLFFWKKLLWRQAGLHSEWRSRLLSIVALHQQKRVTFSRSSRKNTDLLNAHSFARHIVLQAIKQSEAQKMKAEIYLLYILTSETGMLDEKSRRANEQAR
jgi:hypothetical protein